MATDVDMTDLSLREARERVGEMVEMSLRKDRAAILVLREDGVITTIDPTVLRSLPVDEIVEALLLAEWSDDQIEEFLTQLEGK